MRSMDWSTPSEAPTDVRIDIDDNLPPSRALAALSSPSPLGQHLARAALPAPRAELATPPHGLLPTGDGTKLLAVSVGSGGRNWGLEFVSPPMGRRREAAVCMGGAG